MVWGLNTWGVCLMNEAQMIQNGVGNGEEGGNWGSLENAGNLQLESTRVLHEALLGPVLL